MKKFKKLLEETETVEFLKEYRENTKCDLSHLEDSKLLGILTDEHEGMDNHLEIGSISSKTGNPIVMEFPGNVWRWMNQERVPTGGGA